MNKALKKHVFREGEVGGTAFRATLDQGRAALPCADRIP